MAREFIQEPFFDHKSYVNTQYASQIPLEAFLSNLLVRGDQSRILYASTDMAFRKRFQTVDLENGGDIADIKPSQLNFPFVNYWYSGYFEPDDRAYSVQPSQMVNGQYVEGLPAYLRAMAVKTTFSITAMYSRDDDARLAHDLVLWEANPKGPVQFQIPIQWKDIELMLPTFFTIENLQFNPDNYNETEWLKSQRIVPVKFDVVCRTYSIHQRAQTTLDGKERPMSPLLTGVISTDSTDELYLTERVIFNFATKKNMYEYEEADLQIDYDDYNEEDEFTDQEKSTMVMDVHDIATDIVTGYFQQKDDLYVNACVIDNIRQDGFKLKWIIRPPDRPNFREMKILVPGREPIIIDDIKTKNIEINGLYPSSTYDITVLFYTIAGSVTTFKLNTTTLEDPDNKIDTPIKRKGNLRGLTW